MLLAQPAPGSRNDPENSGLSSPRPGSPEPGAARTREALVRIRGTTEPPMATLALCFDCAASHALVRVMRRRNRSGFPTTPTMVLVDKRWPALDALVHDAPESRLIVIPNLDRQVHITPVVLPAPADSPASSSSNALIIGVPAVAALLTPAPPLHERRAQ